MNRRALLLGLAASACQREGAAAFAFARAALGVARVEPSFSEQECLATLEHLRGGAERELKRAPNVSLGLVLSQFLFDQLGFVREVTDTDLRFVLLPHVLRERRGSCVGLGTLFLALAEALGRTANGVLMPGHFYVRLNERHATRNVELLRRGEAMPDAWYSQRFPVPGGAAPEYGRALLPSEVLGVIEYDVGNQRRRQLRLEEARRAYGRAVSFFPGFSEGHASLGATLHLLGKLELAADSYRRARAINPHLPGVDWNIALLEQERQLGR